jgi:hypothetical protein
MDLIRDAPWKRYSGCRAIITPRKSRVRSRKAGATRVGRGRNPGLLQAFRPKTTPMNSKEPAAANHPPRQEVRNR